MGYEFSIILCMEKSYLEELINEGLSRTQIAERSGYSKSTVARRLKQYRLKTQIPRNVDHEPLEQEYLEELIFQGLSKRKIAERCNRSQGSVAYWLKKYGLSTKGVGGPYSTPLPHLCVCGETDPNEFYGKRKIRCKACHKADTAGRFKRHKAQAVREFGSECVICGYSKNLAALEFHHTDPSKKDHDFIKMRHWVFDSKRSELEKCELVCANCHREIHCPELEVS